MARFLLGRLQVTGVLTALDPLHVGSGQEDHETDLAVARNGQGRYYAPGTSLAGAFRAWCLRRFDAKLVDEVWGYQDEKNSANGHATFVKVHDAEIKLATGATAEVRDHVGIDREYQTAANGIKFDRAVLPPGSTLALHLELDLNASSLKCDPTEAKSMLGHLVAALERGEVRLGAAKTRGLGRVQFRGETTSSGTVPVAICEQSYTRKGILARLGNGGEARAVKDLTVGTKPKVIDRLLIEVGWRPNLPTMVKAGVDGLVVDMLPLLGGKDGQMAPVIPGSSIKGALRTRAELILRTLLGREKPDWRNPGSSSSFLEQLDENLPLIQALFGSRGESANGSKQQNANVRYGQGALAVADCFSRNLQARGRWENLVSPDVTRGSTDEQRMHTVTRALANVRSTAWQVAFHNAVDRWTGGAADNMLFQVLEPHDEQWGGFTLELDLDRIGKTLAETQDRLVDATNVPGPTPEALRTAAWVLLLLVLRDLKHQRIPIGFGGNRGLGEVEVTSIQVTACEGSPCGLQEGSTTDCDHGDISHFGSHLAAWQESWKTFIAHHRLSQEPAHAG